ncbi:hypothetical protein C8F01DRAFT_1112894 [Mycena amicta]|nr:hypothetical protein C8F01DRAFT_1112894 [Mycena amicta]
MARSPAPKVYLPLATLEKCAVCQSPTTPRLCSACYERTYCSPTCQKADWPSHKATCGKNDKLGLDTFYPFIACLAHAAHLHNAKPPHPALQREIVNAPNPGSRPIGFPDGSAANLVILGEKLASPELMSSSTWWPQAATDKVRGKMFRRIVSEGQVLPILVAISLALLSEIYTTTAVPANDSTDGKVKYRTRLAYKSSPIADFGIAAGSADVKNQDKLAYWDIAHPDMPLYPGQDPNDHYWLYFTTIRGETVTLDCAMFTFNMCMTINGDPYRTANLPPLEWCPAFFRERMMENTTPGLYTERTRVSVLRNEDLHRVVENSFYGYHDPEIDIVRSFMQNLARREISEDEIEFLFPVLIMNSLALNSVVTHRLWTTWPVDGPTVGIEKDPNEFIEDGLENDEQWAKYLRKFRKSKKAGAGREELNDSFRKWQKKRQRQ